MISVWNRGQSVFTLAPFDRLAGTCLSLLSKLNSMWWILLKTLRGAAVGLAAPAVCSH